MECEICGKIVDITIPVRIESTIMKACSSCARFGEKVEERKTFGRVPIRRPYGGTMAPATIMAPEVELLDDFANMVRNARMGKGLTQAQLGKLINERESVIIRIEAGKMEPDKKLIPKLEHALGVKITGKVVGEKVPAPKPVKKDLTLGDVVEIRKKQ